MMRAKLIFLLAFLSFTFIVSPTFALFKNVASQIIIIEVRDSSGDLLEGDSSNTTATVSKDGGALNPIDDVNPTEIGSGYYYFDMTQSETNADSILLHSETVTAGATIVPVIIYTTTVMRGTDSALLAADVSVSGGVVEGNVVQISGDSASADALEIMYNGTGNTSPTAPASRAQADDLFTLIESQRESHTGQDDVFRVDPVNGDTHANGARGGKLDPYNSVQDCHDNAVGDSDHDIIELVAGAAAGVTTLDEQVVISKRYLFIRGPGRDFIWTTSLTGDTISITGDGVELSGFQLGTAGSGVGDGIQITDADFTRVHNLWILDTRADGINILRGDNAQICNNHFDSTGQLGSGQGVHIVGTAGTSNENVIWNNVFSDVQGDAIRVEQGTTNHTHIFENHIHTSTGWGINIGASSVDALVHNNTLDNNASGAIQDNGTDSGILNNYDITTGVWDELLKATTHNIATSAGRRLRDIASGVSRSDDVVSATTNTLTIDAGASASDGSYDPSVVTVDDGLGNIQVRAILEYFGSSGGNGNPARTLILDRDWKTIPDNTYTYVIQAENGSMSTNEGQIRAGTLTSAQLNPLAPTDVSMAGQIIKFSSGTGQDQARLILAYSTATQTATFSALEIAPDITTGYIIFPNGMATIEAIQCDPQSATDFKDFVDAGYDPDTNKMQGLVLADTVTDVTNDVTTDAASRTASKADVSALALEATVVARTILAAAYFDPAADAVSTVTTTVTNSDMLTAAAVVAAFLAATPTAGGVNTIQDILLAVFSMARGQIDKSTNDYAYRNDNNTATLFTNRISTTARTPQ